MSACVSDVSACAMVQDGLACDDLPERLMLALEAGALNGEGDSRCTTKGIPSDSAFIKVVDKTGQVLLSLSVQRTRPNSPIPALRKMFDAWRSKSGCRDGATAPVNTAPTTTAPATTAPAEDNDCTYQGRTRCLRLCCAKLVMSYATAKKNVLTQP